MFMGVVNLLDIFTFLKALEGGILGGGISGYIFDVMNDFRAGSFTRIRH